jgi:acyl-CoA thioesterase-2
VGDLGDQTAVEELGEGRYRATLHADWEIWGPCGGYVAAVALRAAGAESGQDRPASFYCHYLSVAAFGRVDVTVSALRAGRTVTAQQVSLTQGGIPVLEAMVWSVGEVDGLEHHDERPPEIPGPAELPPPPATPDAGSDTDADTDAARSPRFAFWDNFDQRSPEGGPWPPPGPLPPTWRTWVRYRPTAAFADPWLDAARSLVVLDVGSWPSGSRPHAYRQPAYIAPSLDLYAAFHGRSEGSEWLLLDAHSPLAQDGMLAWTGRIWSEDRRLLASGGGQALFRRVG